MGSPPKSPHLHPPSSREDLDGLSTIITAPHWWTLGPKVILWIAPLHYSFKSHSEHFPRESLYMHSMDSHYQPSPRPPRTLHSSPQGTMQRQYHSTSRTPITPPLSWVTPGSINTTPALTGNREPYQPGALNVIVLVLCLPVLLSLFLYCRRKQWIYQTCPRSTVT